MRTPLTPPPNPGAAATATLLDTGRVELGNPTSSPSRGKNTEAQRVRLVIFADQVVTFHHRWRPPEEIDGTLRQLNGAGGEATTVSTAFIRDVVLQPGRNVLQVVTTTAPTVWEVAIETLDQSS